MVGPCACSGDPEPSLLRILVRLYLVLVEDRLFKHFMHDYQPNSEYTGALCLSLAIQRFLGPRDRYLVPGFVGLGARASISPTIQAQSRTVSVILASIQQSCIHSVTLPCIKAPTGRGSPRKDSRSAALEEVAAAVGARQRGGTHHGKLRQTSRRGRACPGNSDAVA